jgi:hypothetical protein
MIRKIATLTILVGITGFAVPQSFCQQKEVAAQERREHKMRNIPADMLRARQALLTARNELNQSGDQWGGHRVTAVNHINQALEEIQKAEEYAKQHPAK